MAIELWTLNVELYNVLCMHDTLNSFYIIAGEPSGDALGGKLIAALRKRQPDAVVQGVGGARMEAQGVHSLFPIQEISIMGFLELIPHIPNVFNRIRETVDEIMRLQPDVVVTIDSPGFTCRVVKQLRKRGLQAKFVHYVAPTVWAYKPKRVHKMKALFDHLLVLLPFEPPYFEAVGLPTTFVGHPIVEDPIPEADGQAYRERHGIGDDTPVILMLPGSRGGEITRLFPIFAEALNTVAQQHEQLHIAIPTLPHLEDEVRLLSRDIHADCHVITEVNEKYEAYHAAHVALAKSGTATLELAMAGLPMVVAYKVNAMTAWLLKRMLKTKYVNLINILQDEMIIPECLQGECTPRCLSEGLERLLSDPSAAVTQREAVNEALAKMGMGGVEKPSERAVAVLCAAEVGDSSASLR